MPAHCRKTTILLAAAALVALPAFSQTTSSGTTTTGSTASGGTTTSNLPSSTTIGNGNNPNTSGNATQRGTDIPVNLTGRVMLEDGTPGPLNVAIQRVCNGTAHTEGYTDGQGYFAVHLSMKPEVLDDASESSGNFGRPMPPVSGTGSATTAGSVYSMSNRFSKCELRAQLGGYTSQTINLVGRDALDSPDVGIIVLHRNGSVKGGTVTPTTLQAPKAANKAMQKGLDLVKKNKPDEAMSSFREAVNLYPQFAAAWCELGKLQAARDQRDEAHHSFEEASKAEPKWLDPLLELSLLDMYSHSWQEASEVTDRILHLNSFEFPQAYYFNAVANYNLKHLAIAEKSARSAEKLDVQHQYPEIAHLMGTILVARHQYADAALELRIYLSLAPQAPDADAVRKQLADVEKAAPVSSVIGH
jgi:hypothetical protein